MKIAIDCRFISKSGIGTYIENIVDRLLTEHPEHQYLFICEDDSGIGERGNVEIFVTNIKPFTLKELLGFPVSKINHCDAFFSPYINIPSGIMIPIYCTMHDMVFFDVDGLVSPIGKIVRKFYYKRAVRLSKKIFTVSEFSKERILHHLPTSKEIIVGYNGVSKAVKTYDVSNTTKKDYLLYVGNIKKHKGLQTLVKAYSMAQKQGLKSQLIIVGNRDKFKSADKNIDHLVDSTPNVVFTGWVAENRLLQLMAEAKYLIQPSLYEGFGIPPLEALYLGANVIMSDIPVFKEIYSELPVSFFEINDVKILCKKILNESISEIDVENIRKQIDSKYNYSNTAKIILENIK